MRIAAVSLLFVFSGCLNGGDAVNLMTQPLTVRATSVNGDALNDAVITATYLGSGTRDVNVPTRNDLIRVDGSSIRNANTGRTDSSGICTITILTNAPPFTSPRDKAAEQVLGRGFIFRVYSEGNVEHLSMIAQPGAASTKNGVALEILSIGEPNRR